MRTGASFAFNKQPYRRSISSYKSSRKFSSRSSTWVRECPLSKQAGRLHSHFLSECRYLPEQERMYLLKARQIVSILDDESDELDSPCSDTHPIEQSDPVPVEASRRALVRQSPNIDTFYGHQGYH